MIIPMFKYSFLVYHENYSAFLSDIKGLGMVHIFERQDEPTVKMQEEFRQITEIDKLIAFLEKRSIENVEKDVEVPNDGAELVDEVKDIQLKLEHLHQQLGNRQKELRQLEPWGQFSWDNLDRLKQTGITAQFYYCSSRKYNPEWETQFNMGVVSDDDRYTYFVVFLEEGAETPELDAEEIRLPESSLGEVQSELKRLESEVENLETKLDGYAKSGVEVLKNYKNEIQDVLNLENAIHQTDSQVEDKVKLLEGWIPDNSVEELEKYLEENSVLYLKSESKSDEKPPIKLKNGPFSKLFEPIGKLFALPSYMELDLTPYFAPFFLMFFGFCLGDAGYGVLFIVVATILKFKISSEYKPLLTLLQWLGSATVLFGIVTGTFFGMKLAELEMPLLLKVKDMFLTDSQMFNLALIFGFIQIIFGMFIKAANQIKQNGWKYSFATFGWIVVILSTVIMVIIDKVNGADDSNKLMLSTPHLVILGVAALGIFPFNNPKGNIFMNIGAGLWDSYNMITGFAGDLLSYIRLFALGLSSAILGLVFNQLAMNLSPDTPVIGQLVFVIILLFGHGLNIFMATLGSLVHPMRLTFVEFYKNAGFTGGGKEYKPFRKIN